MASGGVMLPSAAAAPWQPKVSLLLSEPSPDQRHVLSHTPASSLLLIIHPRAAWQDLRICLPHASMQTG